MRLVESFVGLGESAGDVVGEFDDCGSKWNDFGHGLISFLHRALDIAAQAFDGEVAGVLKLVDGVEQAELGGALDGFEFAVADVVDLLAVVIVPAHADIAEPGDAIDDSADHVAVVLEAHAGHCLLPGWTRASLRHAACKGKSGRHALCNAGRNPRFREGGLQFLILAIFLVALAALKPMASASARNST